MANLTSSLTVKLIDDVSRPAQTVAQALDHAAKEAKKVADAMKGNGSTDRLSASLARLKLSAKDVDVVGAAWKQYASNAKLAANSADWTKTQAAEVRRWETSTIAALKAVQREEAAFARSQKQAMTQAAHPPAAAHGPSQWGHGGAMGFAAQGIAGAVGAHSVYHASKSALEQGSEYQHERVALMNAGRTADLARMEEAAKLTAKALPTASYTETLKAINETTSSFGSIDHAIENIGFVMKTAAVLKAAAGDKIGGDAGSMGQQYAKFFEMRGTAGNPELFRSEGNEMTRAMVATRGNFNPQEMFNFAQQAKSALRNYDIEYLSKVIPSIIGETGGDRAGTGANAFNNVLLGKARDKKQLAEWMKYGLLDPKMVSDKHDSWTAGAVKGTDLAMRNPLAWFEQVVLPAMKAKGVNVDDKMELTKTLATMFRNSMSNQFANENAQAADRTRLHKDAAIIGDTDTPDSIYKRNLGEDPHVAIDALTESLKNLGAAASAPAMKTIAGTLSSIAGGLQTLAAAAMDHPMTAMTAGGVGATAAMGGAGYLSYQALNGFGLKAAATDLQVAATMLQGAAEKQGIASGIGGAGGAGGKLLRTVPIIGTAVVAAGIAIDQMNAYKARNPGEFHAHAGHAYGDNQPKAAPAGHWEQEPGRNKGYTRHWVDDVKEKADEAKVSLEGLNVQVAPQVDSSAIATALAQVNALRAALAGILGDIRNAGAAASRLQIPSLGASQRSNFTTGGIAGGSG